MAGGLLCDQACATDLRRKYGWLHHGGRGFDANHDAIRREQLLNPVAPLDDGHAGPVDELLEAEVVQFLDPVEAIDVDVRDRQTARVLLHQRERRARDRTRDTEPTGDALRERGLAGSEVADQYDDVTGFEVRGERGRNGARLLG